MKKIGSGLIILIIFQYMGQSIEKPKRDPNLRNSHSRLSARSHQRHSTNSLEQSVKSSCSTSKTQPNQISSNEGNMQNYLYSNKHQQLEIMSKYDQNHIGIKKANQLKSQRISLGGQGSQLSPNFRELNEIGAQYGLSNCPVQINNKPPLSVNHHTDHHNDTISFSKTKNLIDHTFHDEAEQKKVNMKKILEDEVQNQLNHSRNILTKTVIQQNYYLQQQIDKISCTKSICSEDRNSKIIVLAQNQQAKGSEINRNKINQEVSQRNKQMQPKNDKVQQRKGSKIKESKNIISANKMNNTVSYNDYDLASFTKLPDQSPPNQTNKKIKLSKKMQELKQKISSKIVTDNKQKQSILKSCARRLSKSLQKIKSDPDNSQDKSLQDFKTRTIFSRAKKNDSKIMQINVNKEKEVTQKKNVNEKVDQYQIINKNIDKSKSSNLNQHYNQFLKNSACFQKQSTYTFKKPKEQPKKTKEQPKKSKDQPKKLIIFGGNNTFVYQSIIIQNSNLIISNDKDKKKSSSKTKQQPTFTDMIKKQHFSNKNKKISQHPEVGNQLKLSHAEKNKFSPVTHNFYASQCEQKFRNPNEYELFAQNDEKKAEILENGKSQQQMLSLKNITHKLNNKESKLKKRGVEQMRQSQNLSSSQEQSIRNKTYYEKNASFNKISSTHIVNLNYTELIGNYEQYMLRDALNRQKQGYQWAKNERKKHKSLENTSNINGVNKKVKLLVF